MIEPKAHRFSLFLDRLHVRTHWLDGYHVQWKTGIPNEPKGWVGPNTESHCSLFAAAVAYWHGVYIARPPDFLENLLSNAQANWLPSPQGFAAGWLPVPGPREAQHIANRGDLCVISYKSPDPKRPGHIVIVRPWVMSETELDANGPRIAQAGETNYNSTTASVGFSDHPGAWPSNVRYYWHPLA
jgi:hypothetical protein